MAQQQEEIKLNEIIIDIIKRNGPISFRQLGVKLPDLRIQDIWCSLRCLLDMRAIEIVKISNRKGIAYKVQSWVTDSQ
jgi:hypothetical protein